MKTIKMMLGVVVLGTGTLAWAGYKVPIAVQVDAPTRFAYGALGTAHNNTNTIEYIGCKVTTYMSGSATLTCSARDSGSEFGSCTSSAPALVEAARSISSDSYIRFTWLSTGECATLEVQHYSDLEPKR